VITTLLIAANLACAVAQTLPGHDLVARYALWPIGHAHLRGFPGGVGFQPWQLITYSFLHAGPTHLALNMFALWTFGRDIEQVLGARRFLTLYLAAVVTAALVQLVVVSATQHDTFTPTIGASGGVFGILLAFGTLFPRRIVTLLFPPIPMPAWLFVTAYGLIELANGVLGSDEGVAHFAHLGGMLGAYWILRRWRRGRRR
jgi:membrane associated rhomboid family serine protease